MSQEEKDKELTKEEKEKPTVSKYGKYLLFLLIPLIGFGVYKVLQNEGAEMIPISSSDVIEKTLPNEIAPPQAEILNKTQKDNQVLSLKKTTSPNTNTNIFTDARDGKTYQWVLLKDGKKWMAQNLNYQTTGAWCYEDKSSNCTQYGYLYTWQAAKSACPSGWRLPTDEEWWNMASHYGKAYNSYSGQEKMEGPDDGEVAYKALMQGGDTGFTALFGGSYSASEGFDYLGDLGCYWSSSDNNTSNALGYYFYIHSRGLARDSYGKGLGFSCRCVQD